MYIKKKKNLKTTWPNTHENKPPLAMIIKIKTWKT